MLSQHSDLLAAPRAPSSPRVSRLATVAQYLERRLRGSPYADLRSVRVTATDGAIRLDGEVRSFYAKQMAQVLAREGNEACRIENAVRVA